MNSSTPDQPSISNAFVALGSNLDQPLQQVTAAVESLKQLPDSRLIAVSSWYHSRAVGPGKQPDYVNGVVKLETRLAPMELLDALQSIENTQGRLREVRWGARTLDLDLILYGELILDTERLQIPHPRLHERNFVLYPLVELDSEVVLPNGDKVKELCQMIGMDGLTVIDR